MITCPECGLQQPDGAKFCERCGQGLTATAAAPRPLSTRPTPLASGAIVRGYEVLELLAQAHVHGAPVDWPEVFAERGAQVVDLPTYAFQRSRYWLDPQVAAPAPSAGQPALGSHPLLSDRNSLSALPGASP